VANGLEVLEALQLVSYDIILMNCQMPEMDGYLRHHSHELSDARDGRIRSDTSDPQMGTKFGETLSLEKPDLHYCMTANVMQREREKCLAAGMNAYLSKPVRVPEL
jgi:two-component system sensor histidine kinase/response regulator